MKERCFDCPVREKIELYQKAAADTMLALDLAQMQKIGEDELVAHFGKTAQQLQIGCQTEILCKVRGRI